MLHEIGVVQSPDHRVPRAGAPVKRYEFGSVRMKANVRWAISAPEDAVGVVVCLHGRNGDYSHAFDSVYLHDVVADLGARLAIVGVDGGAASYWHKRESGIDPQRMIHDELLPRVDARLGGRLPRALLGWSMGGYGALLTAQRNAAEYTAVAAASPALWNSFAQTPKGAFDSAEDFQEYNVFRSVRDLEGVAVRVDCGTNDPFLGAAREFANILPVANPGKFSRGFHDAAYWRSIAPAQLTTIRDAFDAAGTQL